MLEVDWCDSKVLEDRLIVLITAMSRAQCPWQQAASQRDFHCWESVWDTLSMWQIYNTAAEVMRWLQPDAALGELLCDKELKLHAGEIRPLVEHDMENICSPSSSCLLHCLCTALGGCFSACSEFTFCMLDWLSYRSEALPRYLFISGMLKNTRSSPLLTFDSSSLHGWQLSPPFEWRSDRQVLRGFGNSSDWGQPAGSCLTFPREGFAV